MDEKICCAMCKRSNVKLFYEPSRKTLIMGPMPGMRLAFEYRCEECERKLCKQFDEMLNEMLKPKKGKKL